MPEVRPDMWRLIGGLDLLSSSRINGVSYRQVYREDVRIHECIECCGSGEVTEWGEDDEGNETEVGTMTCENCDGEGSYPFPSYLGIKPIKVQDSYYIGTV